MHLFFIIINHFVICIDYIIIWFLGLLRVPLSGCSGLIESWLAHGKKETPEEMARLISKLISTGMTSVYPIPYGQSDDL